MDDSKKTVITRRIEKTMENFKRNNILAFFVQTREEVVPLLQELIPLQSTIAVGGSATLKECEVLELLRSGSYNFYDRYEQGLSSEEIHALNVKSMGVDFYITGTNAILETGELYNVDGNSNRVAPISFGPENVIVIAGYNKIVHDLDAAVHRVKKIAAPANAIRLGTGTPCANSGECTDESTMTAGCDAPGRICCNYLISSFQRKKDRIKVIIVGESLGY